MQTTDTKYIETFCSMVKAGQVQGKFGPNVMGFYKQKNYVTDGQLAVIKKIVDKVTAPAPAMKTESVGDFSGVIDLFTKAKGKLKYPKITMYGENGETIQLSLAGAKAKKPGTINVTDGKAFGQNIWYGRVNVDGTWEKSFKANDDIGGVLKELSLNPAAFATKYGHKHGHCCFCNKTLTQDNSVAAGFGPVCADNWGLKSEWKIAAK